MSGTVLKLFVTTLLLSGITASYTTSAGQPQQAARNAVTMTTPAADEQREAIASTALRTLTYITRARSAIHGKNLDQARQDVQQARELLALVEAARPAARLKGHLWVARQHMDYESNETVIDDLVLIDAELLGLGDTMPTARAHQYLHRAQTLLKNNDTEAARQALDSLEASLVFTEFDLPLATCEQQILAAQEALSRDQPTAADEHLVAVEESLQFISLGGGAALVGAQTHLRGAAKNYHDEYYSAAKADLAQASEWLQRASKNADKKSRKEAQKLARDINALKDRLGTETDSHAHTFGDFLHRNAVLIEREAEDLWLRYKQQQSANTTLRKLLDAKTHLYYAEYNFGEGRDVGIAGKELAAADRYLEEALSEADPPVRERINQLREQVRALKENLGGDHEQALARYEQAMANLMQLIHEH